jgi:L-galactono-1,4-lactone dehydrogenase
MKHRHVTTIFGVGVATLLRNRSICETRDEECLVGYESSQILSNWSSTHSINISKIYEPKTVRELERLLKYYQAKKLKIRPVGTALSPNGISFPDVGSDAVTVHHFNHITVDQRKNIVTVGAGATVADVLKELAKYGLTLENFSSIQEQQIGGWTQVAAHGTGVTLSTVEEQIIEMKLVSPMEGLLTLSERNLPKVFQYAKVGLGSFGVVTEVTMRCIPQLSLREETTLFDRETIERLHYERLRDYRHVRYMWIPYTPTVVSVVSNPTSTTTQQLSVPESQSLTAEKLPTQELINVIKAPQALSSHSPPSDEFLVGQGFGNLRDLALGIDPLNLQVTSIVTITSPLSLSLTISNNFLWSQHVIKVNQAESDYWKHAQGVRIDDSTKILGFDCGGEQWVMEVCFPMKTLRDETFDDIRFVKEVLKVIETQGIPAPGPIEQRLDPPPPPSLMTDSADGQQEAPLR